MPGSGDLIADRYRLVRQLAVGGMGTVWEGWDVRLQRPVAVKQLHPQPTLGPAEAELARSRAMREGRLTARLHHPHAVTVHDVVDHDGQPCLVMQYLPSISLQELVLEKGTLPPPSVARIGADIASALAAAHRAGIVHRDVKPGNILIAEDGTAKITDFGISHALDDITVTSVGMVSGTPAYLAPEVARGRESTFASDVFSLASTLCFALEGTPPFGTDPNPMAMLHRVASGEPSGPTSRNSLSEVLRAMLAIDPAQRPPMIDVADRLALVAGATTDEPTAVLAAAVPSAAASAAPAVPAAALMTAPTAPSPTAAWSTPGPPRAPRRRRPLVAIVAAVIVLALAVVLAIVLIGQSGGDSGNHTATGPSTSRAPTSRASSARSSARSTAHSTARSTASSGRTTAHSPSPSPSPTTSKPSTTSSTTTSAPGDSGRKLAAAITDYYGLLPGDTDAGWQRLTTRYQQNHAGGRQGYQQFWDAIDSVKVSNAEGSPPGTVTATITYHYKDGRVVDERTSFGLVRDHGVLKIDSSSVDSSVTR